MSDHLYIGILVPKGPPPLTEEFKTQLALLTHPDPEGLHPQELHWRKFARELLRQFIRENNRHAIECVVAEETAREYRRQRAEEADEGPKEPLPRYELAPPAYSKNSRWWCKAHKRIATHVLLRKGMPPALCCDPDLGGIMRMCQVVEATQAYIKLQLDENKTP